MQQPPISVHSRFEPRVIAVGCDAVDTSRSESPELHENIRKIPAAAPTLDPIHQMPGLKHLGRHTPRFLRSFNSGSFHQDFH